MFTTQFSWWGFAQFRLGFLRGEWTITSTPFFFLLELLKESGPLSLWSDIRSWCLKTVKWPGEYVIHCALEYMLLLQKETWYALEVESVNIPGTWSEVCFCHLDLGAIVLKVLWAVIRVRPLPTPASCNRSNSLIRRCAVHASTIGELWCSWNVNHLIWF